MFSGFLVNCTRFYRLVEEVVFDLHRVQIWVGPGESFT